MTATLSQTRFRAPAKARPTPDIAHELNQPLTAVLNYLGALEILLGQASAPSAGTLAHAQQGVRLAREQAQRACEIARRLRETGRYDA